MLSAHAARRMVGSELLEKYWGRFTKTSYTLLVLKLHHSPAAQTLGQGFPSRQGDANAIQEQNCNHDSPKEIAQFQ